MLCCVVLCLHLYGVITVIALIPDLGKDLSGDGDYT